MTSFDSLYYCMTPYIMKPPHISFLSHTPLCTATFDAIHYAIFYFRFVTFNFLPIRNYLPALSANLIHILCQILLTALCQKFLLATWRNFPAYIVLWRSPCVSAYPPTCLPACLPACLYVCLTRQYRIAFGPARFYFRAREWGEQG
jgi:hypothetical protein